MLLSHNLFVQLQWKYTYNKTATKQVNYQSHYVNLWSTTSSDAHGIIKFEFVFIDHTFQVFPLGPFATTGIILELRLGSNDVKTQIHMVNGNQVWNKCRDLFTNDPNHYLKSKTKRNLKEPSSIAAKLDFSGRSYIKILHII